MSLFAESSNAKLSGCDLSFFHFFFLETEISMNEIFWQSARRLDIFTFLERKKPW